MAKIVFVSHWPAATMMTGADRVLLALVMGWVQTGNSATVAFPADCYAAHCFADAGIKVEILPYAFCYNFLQPEDQAADEFLGWCGRERQGIAGLSGLIARELPSLVHVNTLINPAGALAARSLGLPVLWHLHELFQGGTPRGHQAVRQIVKEYADSIICVSKAVRADFGLDNDNCRVIYNGTQPAPWTATSCSTAVTGSATPRAAWRGQYGIPERASLVGFLGTVLPHKGVLEFVRMASVLHCPEAWFVIGGDHRLNPGYTALVQQTIRNAGLADRFRLIGYVSDPAEFLPELDILVLPSMIREPFGMVIIEAMAFQKPVVAFESGGVGELIVPGKTGYLVPSGDVDFLAAKTRLLLQNPRLQVQMGKAGEARVRAKFNVNTQLAVFFREYQKLVRNNPTQ